MNCSRDQQVERPPPLASVQSWFHTVIVADTRPSAKATFSQT